MTVPALDAKTGYLPHGRYRVTEDEVCARFVLASAFQGASTRASIWAEYEVARDLLKSAIRVHGVWFGGSFTTDIVNPNDIDVVFLVSARDYARASTANKQIVDSFVPQGSALGVMKRRHGLKLVDSFVLNWRPWPDPSPNADAEAAQYCAARGKSDALRERWLGQRRARIG